jgi:hypothetical protein
MTIRDWFVLVYCLALLAGTAAILKRNGVGADDFAATRDLPLNWRLQPGDVRRDIVGSVASAGDSQALDAFTGRYLRGPMQRDELLHLRQTGTVPSISVPAGHVMALARFDGTVIKPLNAAQCVTLDGAGKTAVTVAAVLCPLATDTACTAILDLPGARLAAMTGGGKSLPAITGLTPCDAP